ncbi:F-box/kelch-repeat protein SKIP6, partial [Carica papaya]|uniref:F-box/kelch-repeat protein SKIP6 n=1 Tax=Carica papaya TaxID=3649 RepID=UPI000B8D00AF
MSTTSSPATSSTSYPSSSSTTSSSAEPPTPLLLSLIPSLPNDVALNCLARIPRCYHPTLSLVSKSIRSAVFSPQLYTTRSLLNCTQHFLYLSIRLPTSRSFIWYSLFQYPPTPTSGRKNIVLAPVSPIPPPSLIGSAFVSVGPFIYVIGGSINDVPSTHVWVLDCRFNIWHAAPNMRVGREFAAAGLVGDKIYVIGGCVADTWTRSKNWAEVFDLKKESWEPVVSNSVENREKWIHASAVIEGKIYSMGDRNGVVYEPSKEMWEEAEGELDLGWRGRACVIGEVLYCYD